jgi:hypothetical protein
MKYYSLIVRAPILTLVLALSGFAASPAFQADSKQEQTQKPKSDSTDKGSALTGCVDEQEGHYVLIDDRTMSPIANLEAQGFPTESFAKHLGHKVTVRGIVSSTGARPTFKVRSIETVSESCGPHQ